MVKSVTPDAISIILSHPSPDSSTEIPEIVVQVVDLKPAGNTYMFMASDGKMKVKTILQSNLSSEVISGNIQNLGLICILDYTLNDSPTKNEKYLIVTKCETVSPALEAEIKTEVKSEETDPILKPKQEMVIKTEMDSQFDGSFTDLLMNDTNLYDEAMQTNPSVFVSVQNEVAPRVRKSQRTKNFSQEEDKLIVSAWLNTSKDAIIGNEQQGGAFWYRILKYFELHRGNQEKRSQASIKSRWIDINAKCAKFVGFYSQIERLRQSGRTEQNNVDEAKEMFAKIIGRPFQYEHCWNILKIKRKWTDNLPSNKRAKTHSSGSPESNHVESCHSTPYLGDDTEPSSTPNLDRSLGRKALKKQLKNKEKQTGVEASLDHHHWNQRMEVERQKVVQREIALEQHRRQLEIEERQNEWQKEMKIMEIDTTGMDPISASYWNNLKLEIMNKRGFKF